MSNNLTVDVFLATMRQVVIPFIEYQVSQHVEVDQVYKIKLDDDNGAILVCHPDMLQEIINSAPDIRFVPFAYTEYTLKRMRKSILNIEPEMIQWESGKP